MVITGFDYGGDALFVGDEILSHLKMVGFGVKVLIYQARAPCLVRRYGTLGRRFGERIVVGALIRP